MSALYGIDSLGPLPETLKKWNHPTDSGNTISAYFCERCGSRMVNVNTRGYISVKGGLIQGTENLEWEKATHLFTRTKLPWVIIPAGAEQYKGDFPNEERQVLIKTCV
jgi:hypothetical protein